jgi:putative hydrolase of HD superfamily
LIASAHLGVRLRPRLDDRDELDRFIAQLLGDLGVVVTVGFAAAKERTRGGVLADQQPDFEFARGLSRCIVRPGGRAESQHHEQGEIESVQHENPAQVITSKRDLGKAQVRYHGAMQQIIDFFNQAMRLKQLKRAGWRRCGVEPCESVAEHAFGVSVLALILAETANVDRGKCLALAVAHDLAESVVGDITPRDGVHPDEKQRRERQAISKLSRDLGNGQLPKLWEEYEQGATPEAKLVRDLDVIEMAWQARSYVQQKLLGPASADEFIASARQRVKTDLGRRLLHAVIAQPTAPA